MAKKKKTKLQKLNFKKLRKNKQLLKMLPLATLLVGLLVGLIIAWLQPADISPRSLVWVADSSVSVPSGLVDYLQKKHDCQSYRGDHSPEGVALWGIYQTSQNRFAKISYGCSTHMSTYIMAVKENDKWLLIPPTEYFASRPGGPSAVSSYLPKCEFVDQYKIDKTIESFCLEPNGAARENKTEAN